MTIRYLSWHIYLDIGELLHILLNKTNNAEVLDYKEQLFPKLFELITLETHKLVVKMICLPFVDIGNPKDRLDFGDSRGFLSIRLSENAGKCLEKKNYPTAYISSLLKNVSKDFLCVRIQIFVFIMVHVVRYNTFLIWNNLPSVVNHINPKSSLLSRVTLSPSGPKLNQ